MHASAVAKGWPQYVRVQEWWFPQITFIKKYLLMGNQTKHAKKIVAMKQFTIIIKLFQLFSAEN